jgi:LPPG:FO 2-phospho-L-lactate transferase
MKLAALAGGVGASKLLWGLAQAMGPRALTVIVNTGDDIILHGLRISPDLDIVTYTLAGAVHPETGWGLAGDTFSGLEALARYARDTWFRLGDRDLATHIHRTARLRQGATLAEVTREIRLAWGVAAEILPMCDEFVPTFLETSSGRMHFQEYLVRYAATPELRAIEFHNIEEAAPAPGVLEALDAADMILICPSNPLISIGPILAVPGIRGALRRCRARVAAVCPLVGGRSLKGPSDRMMRQLGLEASAAGVAGLYRDVARTFFIDAQDAESRAAIAALDMEAVVCETTMRAPEDKLRLARRVLGHFAAQAAPRARAAP